MMTRKQIEKAMTAAGIQGELSGSGRTWEVELADEKTMRQFCKKISNVGGYRTGYGAWILSPGYKVDTTDYNCTSARIHY